jgi:hypothetical protein
MKIIPTYITFEQAKLLKEKGFDELTTVWRQHGDGISGDVEGKRDYYNRKGDIYTSLPEQQQVLEWLRINHGIWITIGLFNRKYKYLISQIDDIWGFDDKKGDKFNTPQEAYSAAFDYILKELI